MQPGETHLSAVNVLLGMDKKKAPLLIFIGSNLDREQTKFNQVFFYLMSELILY